MAKFLYLIAIFGLLQVTSAETLDEVIKDLEPVISITASTIREIVETASTDIDEIHTAVDELVRAGTSGIYYEIAEIQRDVNEALATGKDVRHCISEEEKASEAINITSVQICRDSTTWDNIGDNLASVSVLEVTVWGSVSNCIYSEGVDPAKVRKCIENILDRSLDRAQSTMDKIQAQLKETKYDTVSCVFDASYNIEKLISRIRQDFKTCVDAVPDVDIS